MVIDGFPAEKRLEPTIELLESLGYQRIESEDLGEGEYSIKTSGGQASERVSCTRFLCQAEVWQVPDSVPAFEPLHQPKTTFGETETGLELRTRLRDPAASAQSC